jgi:hypothetical protein
MHSNHKACKILLFNKKQPVVTKQLSRVLDNITNNYCSCANEHTCLLKDRKPQPAQAPW